MEMEDEELTMEVERKPAKKKKGGKAKLLLLIVLLLALAGGGYWYWDSMNTPPPMPPMAKKQPVKKQPKNTAVAQSPAEMPNVPQYGNLKEYAELDAMASLLQKKKEVVSLEVEIAKIQGEEPNKKKENAEKPLTMRDVKELVSQEVASVTRSAPQRMPNLADVPVRFISIEGVGNSITATVREFNGATLILRPGSAFRGGTVSGISRKGMSVNLNGKRVFYPF